MGYVLVCNPNTDHETIYPLNPGRNTIGRAPTNQIVIKHNSLSRRHAEILVERDRPNPDQPRFLVRDLKSLNGTFVNNVKIKQREITLNDGITLGMVPLKLLDTDLDLAEDHDDPTDAPLPIVRHYSPKQTQVALEDFIDKNQRSGSALRLKEKDQNQRAVDKLKILLEVSKQLASSADPAQLLDKILELLLEIMNVDRAALLLVDERTKKLEQKAVKARSGLSVRYQFYSTKITNYVRRHGDAVLTDDAAEDRRFEGSHSILVQAIRASMCAPLQPRDEVIGVLYVDNLTCSNAYSAEDLEFLMALANQAAIAIETTRLANKMRENAIWRDKLERFFPSTISRKLREGGDLGIIETEVTALFADITDFTKMSSTMEPRAVIEMLNDYFNVMVEDIVFTYEGTLEKYIGDALLAIWGAPYSRPDDTDRAVQVAIEMQHAVQRLNQDWQEQGRQPIAIHIGLNSGPVAAGNIGSRRLIQYAAIGDTTNVTSRICDVAKAGEIILSASTVKRLNYTDYPLVELPPTHVKGKKEPLQLYRLEWRELPSLHEVTSHASRPQI